MKYTKNCILPWKYMLIHAGGLMQTCPCASDLEIGDVIIDYFESTHKEDVDIFNLESLQKVRKGLLTGDLRKMCRDCAFASNELISVEELQNKVIEYLQSKRKDWIYKGENLTKEYAYDQIGVGLSNRCNLRCIYCNQSTCADTNPFYKAEFPREYAQEMLEYIAKSGVKHITAAVEGEVTIYSHWYETYSTFVEKYPDIKVCLTTNLNKDYNEEEIELLAKHYNLDISCDTLDPTLYSKIRVNGNLELLLRNLERISNKKKELGIQDTIINIHVVLCDLTWKGITEVADFAFEKGYGLNIGNYEERRNARGYREQILSPVSTLSYDDQLELSKILDSIKDKALKQGLIIGKDFVFHGDVFARNRQIVEKNYHRFIPVETDVIYDKYYKQNPLGIENNHLDIVYDDDNKAFTGIRTRDSERIRIEKLDGIKRVVVREIVVYKNGARSPKYDWAVGMGYRKIYDLTEGVFEYYPSNTKNDKNIDSILTIIEQV